MPKKWENLTDCSTALIFQEESGNQDIGIDYMVQAAEAGDRGAMIFVAKAFETGNGLGKRRYTTCLLTLWKFRSSFLVCLQVIYLSGLLPHTLLGLVTKRLPLLI